MTPRGRSRSLAADPAELVPPDGGATIAAVRAIGTEGRTVAVVVRRRTVARLAIEDADRLGLRAGLPWTAELAETLFAAARRHAATGHALRLVAARARTRRDLVRRLTIAGHHRSDAVTAAEALGSAGIIDDEAFAEAAAAALSGRKGTSRRGIERKLIAEGVDRALAARAAGENRTAETDAAAAADLAQARVARMRSIEDPIAVKRRLLGYLQRRGFGFDDAIRAVEAALAKHAAVQTADEDPDQHAGRDLESGDAPPGELD